MIITNCDVWTKGICKKVDMVAREKPVSVTLGWDMKPALQFSDGKIYPRSIEKDWYSEYYPDGVEWPVDPDTGEKIPMAER